MTTGINTYNNRDYDLTSDGSRISQGGCQHLRERAPTYYLISLFSKNCTKMKKFWLRGEHSLCLPSIRPCSEKCKEQKNKQKKTMRTLTAVNRNEGMFTGYHMSMKAMLGI